MKPIKICKENVLVIQAALDAANGDAKQHTLTFGKSVLSIAEYFEERVISTVGTKKMAPGAKAVYMSGVDIPTAYKYSRIVTRLEMERKGKDWFLTAVDTETAYNKAGAVYLVLTKEQDEAAIAKLRESYRVAKAA